MILPSLRARRARLAPLAAALAGCMAGAHAADAPPTGASENVTTLDLVNVVGVSPVAGTDIAANKLPYNVQSIDDSALERAQTLDLTDFMNRHLAGVTTNAAAGNPLQPDLQFRGFTATPLLGGSEGMSVYLDGVRVNEVFGDTVNWDLIPEAAIERMSLLAGSNPVFGLNTLGGAISLQTKTGFSDPGTSFEFYGGSFGRTNATFETSGNSGQWGWYLMGNRFDEDGWRNESPSNARNFYGTLSWRGDAASFDLHLGHADTNLAGSGATPAQALAQDWKTIFTADETRNKMDLVSGQGSFNFNDATKLSFTLFHREVKTLSYNGDISDFDACDEDATILCDGDTPILDQNGNTVSSEYDAINNIGHRSQKSDGGTVQLTFDQPLFGMQNQLVTGVDYNRGSLNYHSTLEVAVLQANHITTNPGLFIPDDALSVDSRTRSTGIYATDTLSITDKLALTLSGRSNHTRTTINDPTGDNPDLDGKHGFSRFNPAAGITYQWSPAINAYGGYSESTRAPTPVELTCADPDAPCKLPNDFVSDPPLKQVVAKTWEGGLRGALNTGGNGDRVNWHVGLFRTTNADDILFQSTGGAQSNEGFFANVGDTRRQGVEASLSGSWLGKRLDWYANYTYLDATYLTGFSENSANHPDADDDGLIFVRKGDRIPGLPKHSLKLGADFAVTKALSVGGDVIANSGQYLRGDEANLLGETAGYALLNLRANYTFNEHFSVFARVDNVFDRRYVTFGTLGDPGDIYPDFDDSRFYGPGQPRAGWVGFRVAL
jgi:outer membrane receptor protein involved in Fe transport